MKVRRIWMCAGLILALCGCAREEKAVFSQDFSERAGVFSGAGTEGQPDAEKAAAGPDNAEEAAPAGMPGALSDTGKDAAETGGDTEAAQETERRPIVVDICGAVRYPGVYELREGDRVYDAVQKAGGLTEDADLNSLNQAAVLQDAGKIIVYTVQEIQKMREAGTLQENGQMQADGQAQPADPGGADRKVNINLADEDELCTLSGIGASRARDIIAYREANGGFAAVEEIMNVSGIKDATFNRIKDEITVR